MHDLIRIHREEILVADSVYRVTELVRRAAARAGASVRRSELIGLAPGKAIERTARAYAAL